MYLRGRWGATVGGTIRTMPETNADLARRGFEAALRGDIDFIASLLDPEVKWHGGDPSAAGACRNRDQALSFMRRSEVIRGGRFQLVDVVAAGDRVVVIMRPPAGGGNPPVDVANVATFRDGKVVEMVHYPNADDALDAAGGTRTPTGEPTGS
jgi:ketosteroid isomerase-like protein